MTQVAGDVGQLHRMETCGAEEPYEGNLHVRFCGGSGRVIADPTRTPQGVNAAQSAKALGLDPRTVASWLTQEPFRPRPPRPPASPRDPCTAPMVHRLEREPSAAAQVCQRLREQGFAGGSSLGKASGRAVSPRRQPAVLPLAWAPGAWAQGAGGLGGAVPVGPTPRRLRVLVMVLCSSRRLSVACPVSQTLAHCLACHQHAWECCGGVPPTVRVETLQSAVLQRTRGEAPGLHPTSRDLATHTGVPLAPGHGGQGTEQGRVEQGVGEGKKPCLAGLEIPDFHARHPAARPWLAAVATGRRPGAPRATPTA
jgi:transposase